MDNDKKKVVVDVVRQAKERESEKEEAVEAEPREKATEESEMEKTEDGEGSQRAGTKMDDDKKKVAVDLVRQAKEPESKKEEEDVEAEPREKATEESENEYLEEGESEMEEEDEGDEIVMEEEAHEAPQRPSEINRTPATERHKLAAANFYNMYAAAAAGATASPWMSPMSPPSPHWPFMCFSPPKPSRPQYRAALIGSVQKLGQARFYQVEVFEKGFDESRTLLRRFSHFEELEREMRPAFTELPKLPPKSLVRKSVSKRFIAGRELGLRNFLAVALRIDPTVTSAALREFLALEDMPQRYRTMSETTGGTMSPLMSPMMSPMARVRSGSPSAEAVFVD